VDMLEMTVRAVAFKTCQHMPCVDCTSMDKMLDINLQLGHCIVSLHQTLSNLDNQLSLIVAME